MTEHTECCHHSCFGASASLTWKRTRTSSYEYIVHCMHIEMAVECEHFTICCLNRLPSNRFAQYARVLCLRFGSDVVLETACRAVRQRNKNVFRGISVVLQ